MGLFSVSHDSALAPAAAWDRLVDWPAHARYVPLTSIEVTSAPPAGAGTVFVARTGLGRAGFDDPMEVVEWRPPAGGTGGRCRIEKRGTVVTGWAELTVEPRGTGSRSTWREQVTVRRAPRFADGITTAASRRMFGRLLRRLLTA